MKAKGTLLKKDDKWYVMRIEEGDWETYYPLYSKDAELVPLKAQLPNGQHVMDGKQVEFEIVISALDFVAYAQLIPAAEQTNGARFDEFMKTVEYPELEGTINLCNDMIVKRITDQAIDAEADKHYDNNGADVLFAMGARWCRDQFAVPAQDENHSELDQIKRYKDRHVKEQNYMIATLYKEIERLLSKHAQTTSFDTPSQTEISDEEIQKAAESQATFAPSFVRGVEWYREQLKKK
jgi:hypothetical protein